MASGWGLRCRCRLRYWPRRTRALHLMLVSVSASAAKRPRAGSLSPNSRLSRRPPCCRVAALSRRVVAFSSTQRWRCHVHSNYMTRLIWRSFRRGLDKVLCMSVGFGIRPRLMCTNAGRLLGRVVMIGKDQRLHDHSVIHGAAWWAKALDDFRSLMVRFPISGRVQRSVEVCCIGSAAT